MSSIRHFGPSVPGPKHPQPGFYETTQFSIEDGEGKGYIYDHHEFERQRDREPWTFEAANERAYEAMLDAGWTPAQVPARVDGVEGMGVVLVPPSPEVKREIERREQVNRTAETEGKDRVFPGPGRSRGGQGGRGG